MLIFRPVPAGECGLTCPAQTNEASFLRLMNPSYLGRGFGTTLYKVRVSWQGERSGFWLGNEDSGSHFYLHNIFLLNAVYNNDMKHKNCQIIRTNTAVTLSY